MLCLTAQWLFYINLHQEAQNHYRYDVESYKCHQAVIAKTSNVKMYKMFAANKLIEWLGVCKQ